MKKKQRKTAKKSKNDVDGRVGVDPAFAPIVRAFARNRDVSQKRMFSSNCVLSVKGRIFAMFVKGEFVAKLPKARVDELVESGNGRCFDPGHGRLMKEWVSIRGRRATWQRLAREAYEFVKG